jgi:tetratricopeptide (TPR) repeat protein
MDLGDAYRRLNQPAQARDAYRRAMDLEEGDLSRDPRNSQNRAFAGYLAARLNDRSRAETEVGQALQLTPVEADSRYLAALTYETIDLRDKALGALRAATRESLLDIGRRPDMAEFSRDSRFQSLIAAAVIH